MTIVQFINLSLVVLIVNFSLFEDRLFGFIAFFNGDYSSFDKRFYENIGKTLQTALMMQIVLPQLKKLQAPARQVLSRLSDRGFKGSELNERGGVNTKKGLQEELNALYTGAEMASAAIYAQNYTYFWAVLFYSTGCPLLYPLAGVFYTVQYWYQKSLALRYHRRSSKFSDRLPIESVAYLRIAVVMHALMAYMMLSEEGLLPGKTRQTLIDLPETMLGGGKAERVVAFINENFKKRHTLLYQGFILAIVVFYCAQYVYKRTLHKFLAALKEKCFGASDPDNEAHSTDFYRELNIDPLTDANNKAIVELQAFAAKPPYNPADFVKYRYSEEVGCKAP